MSRALGLAVLAKDYRGDRIPVMEHLSPLSREAIRHFSGIDPIVERNRVSEAFRKIADIFEVDMVWGGGLPGGGEVYDWSDGSAKTDCSGAKVAQWGIFGAVHQEDGRHLSNIPMPKSADEALEFDIAQYCPGTIDDYVKLLQNQYDEMSAKAGGDFLPLPQFYTTCFHWPLGIFGFQMLCEIGMQEDRFDKLMERFVKESIRVTTAWSRVKGLKAMILHDDLTISQGPIFHPDWYRRHIFVHYPAIFKPLIDAGISIIFTSDGDCTAFVDDIFAAGAEGLNFEHYVDMEYIVGRHPDKILIGNLDSHTLAAGPVEKIESEVRRCIEIGSRAPRFVLNPGGALTHDIPVSHLEYYLNLRKDLCRNVRKGSRVKRAV